MNRTQGTSHGPLTARGWNRIHPVGTRVEFDFCERRIISRTTSEAFVNVRYGGSWVRCLGVAEPVSLGNLRVIEEPSP